MNEQDPMFTYVARKECGCLVGTVPDSPAHVNTVSRRVAEWIRAGYNINRVADDITTIPRLCRLHAAHVRVIAGFEEVR